MPVLVPHPAGQIAYVDGHMMAPGAGCPCTRARSRCWPHHGRLASCHRHDEAGQALFVAYYRPTYHLSQIIVDYCQKLAGATGSTLFVIDRAVNAVAMARAFDDQGLGLLCMLDDNEHQGLESFEAAQVDTLRMAGGSMAGRGKRPDHMIPDTLLSSSPRRARPWYTGATPKVEAVLAATEWPRVYRERNESRKTASSA